MLLEINSKHPNPRHIAQVVECLKDGGIIIYPTDTIYGIGCDIFKQSAVERICRLKKLDPEKAMLSMVCQDISDLTNYILPIDNQVFRLMKRTLPGPYTYILKGSNNLPKVLKNKRRTIGIRIPDNNIARAIVKELGNPILSTSLTKDDDDLTDYQHDPAEIFQRYEKLVDIVIDGGFGSLEPSTIINCLGQEPELIREGAGKVDTL